MGIVQVLRTLATPQTSKPFAINKQYKSNMLSESTDAVEPAAEPQEPPAKKLKTAKPSKTTKKIPKEKPAASGGYQPHKFNEERLKYIQQLKSSGCSHSDALGKWQESSERAALLRGLSVSELIRRRFVPKGTKTNPWL